MRKYLACFTDWFLEKQKMLTMSKDVRVFEVGMVDWGNNKVTDGENEYDIKNVHIMELIGRKDINEKELHEGAIIKADIETYGVETFNNTKGLTGFIEYNKDLSLYHMVLPDCHIPIGDLENIEKIGIMPIDANLLNF